MILSLTKLFLQRTLERLTESWLYLISGCSGECAAFVRSPKQRDLANIQLETWQTFQVVDRGWWQNFNGLLSLGKAQVLLSLTEC